MESGAVKDLRWDVSPAFPDLSKTYSLSYNPHWNWQDDDRCGGGAERVAWRREHGHD